MWDPLVYRRFGAERARPFVDLLARVGATAPRAVVDLGCGPGELTATLAERWPQARITGLDAAPEMIAKAAALDPAVAFTLGDLRDFRPASDVDVLVSNAALQWVPEHRELLARWAADLAPGAWLAFQVPGNFAAPSHQALRAVAAEDRFAATLAGVLRAEPVDEPSGYAALLLAAGCTVDAWETTYVHLLPDDDATAHPVLRWLDGTALRPVRAALDDTEWQAFRDRLQPRLAAAYPVRDGLVHLAFRRIFVVARTATAASTTTGPTTTGPASEEIHD